MKTDVRPDVMKVLADRHREFLRFFEPRVDSRVATEELLQTAFVKALERGGVVLPRPAQRADQLLSAPRRRAQRVGPPRHGARHQYG